MTADGRMVIITSGGDWCDASFIAMNIPEWVDLKEAYKDHRRWLKEVYWPSFDKRHTTTMKCIHFPEWLVKKHGASLARVEEFHES